MSVHSFSGSSDTPEIALLVSSYNKPDHLRKCLVSIALQRGLATRPEIVVTDDGSDRPTLDAIEQTVRDWNLPVTLTTHPHAAFQLTRCRNDGVRHSRAPYLLFLDGDCILPPDHVAWHLRLRRPGYVMSGDCLRLDQATSRRIGIDEIQEGRFNDPRISPRSERMRLRKRHWSTHWYRWIRHPRKPSLVGNNVGIWRGDYERVNGYDEEFVGWGCEDDDLARRLRQGGVQIRSVLHRTCTFHLWHPIDPTTPMLWRDGVNVARLLEDRPTVCERGLVDMRDPELRAATLPMRRVESQVARLEPPRTSLRAKRWRTAA